MMGLYTYTRIMARTEFFPDTGIIVYACKRTLVCKYQLGCAQQSHSLIALCHDTRITVYRHTGTPSLGAHPLPQFCDREKGLPSFLF